MPEFSIVIPFPGGTQAEADKGQGFHGILRLSNAPENASLPDDGSRQGQPLAIFNHGLQSHKNSLFFKPLAAELDFDSFRWDARGEGDTPGEWRAGYYDEFADDLSYIVDYLHRRFGYVVDMLVGHSKACAMIAGYVSRYCTPGPTYKHRPPSRLIFAAGRIYMWRMHRLDKFVKPSFEKLGYMSMTFEMRGEPVERRMYPEDHESQCSYPAPKHYARIPSHVHCYIVHGTDDNVVPVIDSGIILNTLTAQQGRPAGSVHLQLLENADHNLKGDATREFLEELRPWLQRTKPSCLLNEKVNVPVPVGGARGALIAIEGLDRSGKSTQVERLVQQLGARLVKFPERTTAIGSMIDSYLTNKSEINDQSVHLLFSANRWEMLSSILQTLSEGQHVVCDRYAFSGIAYSHAKGLDLSWCAAPDVGMPLPDITLFLDLDEAEATKRAAYGEERYEKRVFQRQVRHSFGDVALLMQRAGARWERIDAGATPDDVWHAVYGHVQDAVRTARTSPHLWMLNFRIAAMGMGMLPHVIDEKATL